MGIIRENAAGNVTPRGKVMTSMGLRDIRPPVCYLCRDRKEGQIYSRDPNGNFVCEDCASTKQKELLADSCDPEKCHCKDG